MTFVLTCLPPCGLLSSFCSILCDPQCLIQTLVGRTNADMAQLKHVFQSKYHRSLEQTVKSDVSGYFEKLLVVCIQVKCLFLPSCSSNVVRECRTISDTLFLLVNRAPVMRSDTTSTMLRETPRHCTRQERVEWAQTSRNSSTSSPTDPMPTFDLSSSSTNLATAKSLARSSSRSSPDGSKLRLFTWVSFALTTSHFFNVCFVLRYG